jgi:hypothetical protein
MHASESVISRTKGKKLLVIENHGAGDGYVLAGIRTNKPLTAGEWVVALRNLTEALERFDQEYGG